MKKLLSSKRKEGGPLDDSHSSAAELAHYGEGGSASDSYNPFADDNPFLPAAGSDRSHVVESILQDHALHAGRGFQQREGAAGALQQPLQDVPLHDVQPALRSRAPQEAFSTNAFESRLPLGNPFLANMPSPDRHEAVPINPFDVEQSGDAELRPVPPVPSASVPSAWTKRGSAAEPYELATPQPPAAPSRRSLSAMGASDGWGHGEPMPPVDIPSKKGRASFRLWGRKEDTQPPPLPVSSTPSFGTMLPPPGGATNGGYSTSTRSEELDQRERELAKREAEVARREVAVARAGGGKGKNWPRFYPLFHHDIAGEVPAGRQALVRTAYLTWLLICSACLYNWLVITIMFASGEKSVSLWLFASLVAGFGVPISFLCWYRSLYFAAIKDGALRWGWYFIHMTANLVWDWWMFVGVQPKLGGFSAGLFTMIEQLGNGGGKGTAFGILSVINMVMWGVGGCLTFYLLGWAMKVFRGRDPGAAVAAPPPPTRHPFTRGGAPAAV